MTLFTTLAVLGLTLTLGALIGYYYAVHSSCLSAAIDHTLSRLDAEREFDELRAWQHAEADKWLAWDTRSHVPGDSACGPPPWEGR